MNTSKLLILIHVLITATACSPQPGFRDGILAEEFVYEEAPFPSCHASTIAETPVGLVTAFFGGAYERHPDVCIYLSRRTEEGWSTPEEAANGIINDTLLYPTWNLVLFQVPEGELILFYKVGPSPSKWWGMLKRSTDGGITWSEAEALPDGYIGPVKNKPVLLDDGTLICPTSTEDQGWRIHFEFSSDNGHNWTRTDPINNPQTFQAIQPSILFHPDGKLQILARTLNSVLVTSWSEDLGKSWSLLQESGLPNNNSGMDAMTLEDSEIGEYSYPSVIQSADGMVHVVYTWRREKIKYVKIDPKQLRTSPIVSGKWPQSEKIRDKCAGWARQPAG